MVYILIYKPANHVSRRRSKRHVSMSKLISCRRNAFYSTYTLKNMHFTLFNVTHFSFYISFMFGLFLFWGFWRVGSGGVGGGWRVGWGDNNVLNALTMLFLLTFLCSFVIFITCLVTLRTFSMYIYMCIYCIYIHEPRPCLYAGQLFAAFQPCFRSGAGRRREKK